MRGSKFIASVLLGTLVLANALLPLSKTLATKAQAAAQPAKPYATDPKSINFGSYRWAEVVNDYSSKQRFIYFKMKNGQIHRFQIGSGLGNLYPVTGGRDTQIPGFFGDWNASTSNGHAISPMMDIIVREGVNGGERSVANVCLPASVITGDAWKYSTATEGLYINYTERENGDEWTGRSNDWRCYGTNVNTRPDILGLNVWINNYLHTYYPKNSYAYKLATEIVQAIIAGQVQVKKDVRSTSAPQDKNVKKCEDSFTEPMWYGQSDAEVKKTLDVVKQALLDDKINQEHPGGIQVIQDYFNNMDASDISSFKAADMRAYKDFYSTEGSKAKFPNVELTNEEYQRKYLAIQEALIQKIPADVVNTKDKWLNIAGQVSEWTANAAGAAAGLLIGGKAAAMAGAASSADGQAKPGDVAKGMLKGALIGVGITSAAISLGRSFISDTQVLNAINRAIPEFITMHAANFYIQKNNEYNKCLKKNGDPYARTNDKIAKNAASILQQSKSILAQQPHSFDECGSALSSGGIIEGVIQWFMCKVVSAIAEFVNYIVGFAKDAAEQTYRPPPKTVGSLLLGLAGVKTAHAYGIPLHMQLDPKSPPGVKNQNLIEAWEGFRTFIDVFLILGLIIIAFAQIFRININTYGVKKVLPMLLLGVVLANASAFICRELIYANIILVDWVTDSSPGGLIVAVAGKLGFSSVGMGSAAAGVFFGFISTLLIKFATNIYLKALGWAVFILLLVILLIMVVGWLFLAVMLYMRVGIVYLLFVLSPVAFLSIGLPFTNSWFKKWWSEMLKWTFLPFLVYLVLRLASLLPTDTMIGFVMVMGLVYASWLVPLKLNSIIGGAAVGFIAGNAKKLGGGIVGAGKGYMDRATGGKTPWNAYKGWTEERNRKAAQISKMGEAWGGQLQNQWDAKSPENIGDTVDNTRKSQVAEARKRFGNYNLEQRIQRMAQLADRKDESSLIEKEAILLDLHENNDMNELLKYAGSAHKNGDYGTRNNLLKAMGYNPTEETANDTEWQRFENEVRNTVNSKGQNTGIYGPEAVKAVVAHMFGDGDKVQLTDLGNGTFQQQIQGASDRTLGVLEEISTMSLKNSQFHLADLTQYDVSSGKKDVTGDSLQIQKALDKASKLEPQAIARSSVQHLWEAEDLFEDASGSTYRGEASAFALEAAVQDPRIWTEGILAQYGRAKPRNKKAIERILGKVLKHEKDSGGPREVFDFLSELKKNHTAMPSLRKGMHSTATTGTTPDQATIDMLAELVQAANSANVSDSAWT